MPPQTDMIDGNANSVTDNTVVDDNTVDTHALASLLGFLGLQVATSSLAIFVTLAAGMAVLGAIVGGARRYHVFGAPTPGTDGGDGTDPTGNRGVDGAESFPGDGSSSGGDAVSSTHTSSSGPRGQRSGVVALPSRRETVDEHGTVHIGKIAVQADTVLGRGSMGTIVYKGTYDGHDIAVKRMLSDYYELARHEVDLLRKSDDHPNVVRYFCTHACLSVGRSLCGLLFYNGRVCVCVCLCFVCVYICVCGLIYCVLMCVLSVVRVCDLIVCVIV